MLLNSTLDILEISENKRVSYFFFTKFWVRPWFLPHPPRMPSSASLLPSSLLFLFPLSAPPRPAPLLSFAKAPCESCEESILQQAHPISRLSGDAGGSFWCSEPQKLFASITRWPSVWLCGFALCYLLPLYHRQTGIWKISKRLKWHSVCGPSTMPDWLTGGTQRKEILAALSSGHSF